MPPAQASTSGLRTSSRADAGFTSARERPHGGEIHDRDEHADEQADCGETGRARDAIRDRERNVGVEAKAALEAGGERRLRQPEEQWRERREQHAGER